MVAIVDQPRAGANRDFPVKPLHPRAACIGINAVIFAFGGCALFASTYYIVQRTCHVRLFSGKLANLTVRGWQFVIVVAAVTLPLGITQTTSSAVIFFELLRWARAAPRRGNPRDRRYKPE